MSKVAGGLEDGAGPRHFKKPKSRFEDARLWALDVAERGDHGPFDGLLAIESLIRGDETFIFDGMDCPGPCGWDGVKTRCFCGHKRVYWSWNPRTRKWRAAAC